MFVTKKNEMFRYTFILSSEEASILAEPIVTIKDLDRNLFFNRFAWVATETSINLESDQFGVIDFSMKFLNIGRYEATFYEPKTEQRNVVQIEVVSGNIADTNFPTVFLENFGPGEVIKIAIKRTSDQFYWTGLIWQIGRAEILMDIINLGNSRQYEFSYSEEETFMIEIIRTTGGQNVLEKKYTLDFRKGPFELKQGLASNVYVLSDKSLITKESGVLTNSVIKFEGNFVKDALMKVFILKNVNSVLDSHLYHETHTDKNGKWRIFVSEETSANPPVLIVEKEGFSSLSFQLKPSHFELKYVAGGVV